MGDPSVVCTKLGGTAGQEGSCVLSPPDEKAKLKDWEYVLNFRPRAVKDRIKQLFPGNADPGYHPIEDGLGALNLDCYPVQISKLPTVAGSQLSAESLVKHIRTHLGDFLDPSIAKFEVYDRMQSVNDAQLWESDSPLGAVMHFRVAVTLGVAVPGVTPEKAMSVVTSEVAPDHWIFSTLPTPHDGDHPVSGNRKFGCAVLRAGDTLSDVYTKAGVALDNQNGDALYFYARGADRCTTGLDHAVSTGSNGVFAGGHALWLSLQQRVMAYVVQNGGTASVPGYVSERWDWDAIRRGGLGGLWIDPSR